MERYQAPFRGVWRGSGPSGFFGLSRFLVRQTREKRLTRAPDRLPLNRPLLPSLSDGPGSPEKVECPCVVIPCGSAMNTKNYTNMVEAIEELKKRGFITNFEFLDQTFRDVRQRQNLQG